MDKIVHKQENDFNKAEAESEKKEAIRKKVMEFGADVCGFAGMERFDAAPKEFHPKAVLSKCKSAIVFGVAIPKGVFESNTDSVYAKYNLFSCGETDRIAFMLARYIEKQYGEITMPLPSDEPYDYWDKDKLEGRGLISMKHAAVAAGLGCLGKSTLFINKEYGNRLTIGAVLSELVIESDRLAENICIEGCSLCLTNCPVQALDGTSASQKLCRPNAYGYTKKGLDTVKCNRCRLICPRRYGI